ncbi:MAG: hypothetical protein ULS35scaffold63_59 [Phage 33_17]|nr:MAG: hypothetical protein ULS35scaffold63_59 [Phage 33_17]
MRQKIVEFIKHKYLDSSLSYDHWQNHPEAKNSLIRQSLDFEAGRRNLAAEILEFLNNLKE